MRIAPVMLAALVMAPPPAFGAKPVTTVYVTSTRPAGSSASDDEARGLADAARELRDAIARKKGLRVVDDPAAADVQVEVTNREQRDAGEGGFGGIKLTPLGEMIIRFHAKFTPHESGTPAKGAPRTDEVDLKGIGPGYWSRAARDGATRLAKWIANRHLDGVETSRTSSPASRLERCLAISACATMPHSSPS